MNATEIVEALGKGIDAGISGLDLLKESEKHFKIRLKIYKKYPYGKI